MSDDTTITNVKLATELTIAWLGNHNTRVSADDVPAFLQRMHDSLIGLTGASAETPTSEAAEAFTPAVSARKSLASPDHIISMIDGKPYKTLRRHLASNGLTPDEYRQRYNLKADYPMVAEGYSASRREMAHKLGLGRKRRNAEGDSGEPAPADAAAAQPEKSKRARRTLKVKT